MQDVLRDALRGVAAAYADIRWEHSIATRVLFQGRELYAIGETVTSVGTVRVMQDGGWGYATVRDPAALSGAVEAAARAAVMVRRPGRRLAPQEPEVASARMTAAEHPRAVPLGEKHDVCAAYHRQVLAAPGVAAATVSYLDRVDEVTFVSTEGRELVQERIFTGVDFGATMRDGANVQMGYDAQGGPAGFEAARGQEARVERAVRMAEQLLHAEPARGGVYTVVLDPEMTGVFTHEAFGHLSEADFTAENPRMRETLRLGRRLGGDHLSITDDGTVRDTVGWSTWDDEGTPTQRVAILTGGVLTSLLHSRDTAAQMEHAPTGNARAMSGEYEPIVRMRATFIERGTHPVESLFEGIEDGYYVVGARGGQTAMEQFTFAAKQAYGVEHGKVTAPVRDLTLAGNVFETLHNIEGIGSDFALYNSGANGGCGKGEQWPVKVALGGPHVRIRNVVVGAR